MSSRFNTLYHGIAEEAADILDGDNFSADISLLLAALTNALRKIAKLEIEVQGNIDLLEIQIERINRIAQLVNCPQ